MTAFHPFPRHRRFHCISSAYRRRLGPGKTVMLTYPQHHDIHVRTRRPSRQSSARQDTIHPFAFLDPSYRSNTSHGFTVQTKHTAVVLAATITLFCGHLE